MDENRLNAGRRDFLRRIGLGAGSALAMMVMEPLGILADEKLVRSLDRIR